MVNVKVKEYLIKKIKQGEKIHLSLIDPADQRPEKVLQIANKLQNWGTDGFLIGGSYNVRKEKLDEIVKNIRDGTVVPIILFPSSVAYITKYAHAIFFLSLLNSNDPRYIVREPARGAPIIKRYQIEPISVGYLLIEPGMRVGKKGKARLIKRDDYQSAIEYALFAQYIGTDFLYLEAGSGSPQPVPNKMIKAVKKEITIPLIVGGGIVNAKIAKEKIEAGADVIVTGNIIEKKLPSLEKIISTVKKM